MTASPGSADAPPDPTPPSGDQHHTAKVVIVLAVLVSVLVIVGALLYATSSRTPSPPPPTAAPAPATTAAPVSNAPVVLSPPAAGCPMLATRGAPAAGAPGLPVQLKAASYTVDKSTSPAQVAWAGELTGTIPAGSNLWVLSYPRADSFDSTPQHHPGSARLYPIGEIITADGCWSLPPRSIGYPEALGLVSDQYVVLADDASSQDFADERVTQRRDGFALQELRVRAAPIVGIYAIPTTP